MEQVERELQYACDDLDAVERWIRSQPAHASLSFRLEEEKTQHDRYLDTADWVLWRARTTLRVRQKRESAEATLKGFGKQSGSLRTRLEINQPLPDAETNLYEQTGDVSDRLRVMTGGAFLLPLFLIETKRRVIRVDGEGKELAEISLDDTRVIVDNETRRHFFRVEIEETAAGGLDAVAPFVDALQEACGLRLSESSKFQEGLLGADLQPEQMLALGPTDISVASTAGEYAYGVLRGYFAAFLRHEPGTRLGEDPEALHDMRVASRRLRAALSTFGTALPPRLEDFKAELKWIALCLGNVRDLDVQIEWLRNLRRDSAWEEGTALGPLIEDRVSLRLVEREALLQVLDSERYRTLLRELRAALIEGEEGGEDASLAIRAYGAQILKKRHRQFERQAATLNDTSEPAAFHAVRIRAKRFRYTTEALAPLYAGAATRLVESIKQVQDVLGEHQDCAVTIEWLRQAARSDKPWPAMTFVRIGEVSEQQRYRMSELRAQATEVLEGVEKPWRRLRKAANKAEPNPDLEAEAEMAAVVEQPELPTEAEPHRSMLSRILARRHHP